MTTADATPPSIRIDDLSHPVLPDEILRLREKVRGAASRLPFQLEAVEEKAAKETGLGDFGEPLYREPYSVLLGALDREAGLNPLGRLSVFGQLVQFLKSRLLVVDYLKKHPEASTSDLDPPIILAGPPRSGTTLLHNLIAAGPDIRSLRFWEALEPVAPLSEQARARDGRPKRASASLEMQEAALPHLRRMHEIRPDDAHEDIHLLAVAGSSSLFDFMAPMPSWREWFESADQTPYYLWMRNILRVLQHQRGPDRWVLKAPQHGGQLGPLQAAFPDAFVVLTHRDPVSIAGSFFTMVTYAARASLEEIDPVRFGAYWRKVLELGFRRLVEDRGRFPADRSLDVSFDEFMGDEIGVLRRILGGARQPFPADVESKARSYLREHPRGRWGRVVYDLATFGVDPRELRASLKFYSDRFKIRDESSEAGSPAGN